MFLAIFNVVFVLIVLTTIILAVQTASKHDWAFGDEAKREVLGYRFMRLVVLAVFLSLFAAAVNIIILSGFLAS